MMGTIIAYGFSQAVGAPSTFAVHEGLGERSGFKSLNAQSCPPVAPFIGTQRCTLSSKQEEDPWHPLSHPAPRPATLACGPPPLRSRTKGMVTTLCNPWHITSAHICPSCAFQQDTCAAVADTYTWRRTTVQAPREQCFARHVGASRTQRVSLMRPPHAYPGSETACMPGVAPDDDMHLQQAVRPGRLWLCR
jgi:hypothetical protein